MQNATWRVRKPHLRLPTALLFHVLAHAGHCPTGTSGTHERIKLTLGLLPDLWTGGVIVHGGICGVVELVGPYGVLQCSGVPLGLVVVVLWVFVRNHGNGVYVRTEHAQDVHFLLAL